MISPEISVIIPTFNRAAYVGEALESVLSQSILPAEIIVVDDGSTDGTRQVISSFGSHVRYIHQHNRGVSSARNRGIAASRGAWLAFLDSDDIWLPDMLVTHQRVIERWPYIAAHVVNMIIDRPGTRQTDLFSFRRFNPGEGLHLGRPLVMAMKYHCAWVQNTLVRKEAAYRAGLFREDLHLYEDLDFFFRLALTGPWHISPSIHARVHRRQKHNLSQRRRIFPVQSLAVLCDVYSRMYHNQHRTPQEKRAAGKHECSVRKELGLLLLHQGRIRDARAQFFYAIRKRFDAKAIAGYLFTEVMLFWEVAIINRGRGKGKEADGG